MLLLHLIGERFLDQYHLFYRDNLSQMCFFRVSLSSRQSHFKKIRPSDGHFVFIELI